MVRVVSCHHFVSQDVFLSESEPVAFCGAQDKLLVSTTQHAVNVHDLDARGTVLHSFPTVDIVKQIIYCNSGNYVATIETKPSWHRSLVAYVRVYFKWWIETTNQALKVRVAGCVPASEDSNSWSKFEMVELPLEKPAIFISCCNKTSALSVSVGNIISVFCHSRKLHPTTKLTFQDFEHFLDISVPFIVQELDVCENYFACRSDKAVHVFKIMCENEVESTDEENSADLTINHQDSDIYDENFIEWRFESCTNTGGRDKKWEQHIKQRLDPKSFPIDIHFHAIVKENENFASNTECEFHGPMLTVRGCMVDVRIDSKAFEMFPSIPSNIYAVTLLFRQFLYKKGEATLSALQLVPFYKTEAIHEGFVDPLNAAAQESEKCTFSLPFRNLLPTTVSTMKATGCFFSTSQEGYLYECTNQPHFISSYLYTSSMKGAVLETTLLHALTDTGLETYTVHLVNSVVEQREVVDNLKNIVPNLEDAVCLLGLRPFLGVDHLVASDNHLILVSSVEDSVSNTEPDGGNRSTLYSLKEPASIQVYADLLEVAESQKSTSPQTYYHLLTEAHLILRAEISFGKRLNREADLLYKKSCLLLADFFLCFDPANNMNSVPYYHLSQLPVEAVIKRILDYRHQAKYGHVLKPLLHYLNSILLDENQSFEFSLNTGDVILSAYADEAPEMLWKVILCSNFSGYKPDKAILLLKRRLTNKRHPLSPISNAADTTALVYLLIQKGSSEVAQNMVLSLIKADLVSILSSIYSKMWAENGLSIFGKFIKKVRPDAFVELLISYMEAKKFTFSELLQVLKVDSPDADLQNVPLLKEFLESSFSEKSLSNVVDSSATVLLAKIYLKRLLESRQVNNSPNFNLFSGIVSSFANFFNSRPPWLNDMPPFYGKGIARNCLLSKNDNTPNEETDASMCCCWACNEDLLKLQSLLAYFASNEEIKSVVLDFICSAENQTPNWLSLEVMCSNEVHAVKRLVGRAPKALLPYAKETFKEDRKKWSLLFTVVYDHMKIIPDDHPDVEVYSQTFHAILGHLAETLKPVELLDLLPQGENKNFVPHVKRCVEKHQADQLKDKIMSLGQEIKSMMLS